MSLGQNVWTVSWNCSFETTYLKPSKYDLFIKEYAMLEKVCLENYIWKSIYEIVLFGTLYLGKVWNSMFGTLYYELCIAHSIFGSIFLEHNK